MRRATSPATHLLAALLAVGLLLGACSRKEATANDLRQDLSTALQKGSDGLTAKQADCYAKLIVDKVGKDKINKVSYSAKEPTKALADQIASVAVQARTTCNIPNP